MQYSESSIMVCGWRKAKIIDENTMVVLKTIYINTINRYSAPPLLFSHIIPETDSRFLLEFYDSQLIYLIKIETGER